MENFILCAVQSIDFHCNSTDWFPDDMNIDLKWVARSFQFKFFCIFIYVSNNIFPNLLAYWFFIH